MRATQRDQPTCAWRLGRRGRRRNGMCRPDDLDVRSGHPGRAAMWAATRPGGTPLGRHRSALGRIFM